MTRPTPITGTDSAAERPGFPPRRAAGGFSLLELLLSIAIIAVLIGLLLPMLVYARGAARTTLCAANLRQMSTAWSLYLSEYNTFPQYTNQPDWMYGGVDKAIGALAPDRPINSFIAEGSQASDERVSGLFRCPADKGIVQKLGGKNDPKTPVLDSCYDFFGTSYRANPYLMDSTRAGMDALARPLGLHEIEHVPLSRLLLVGDAEWYYATLPPENFASKYDASWHDRADAGNMLAVDGSVRFVDFHFGESNDYIIFPRPSP